MSADSTTRRPASGYIVVLAIVFSVGALALGLTFLIGMATIFGDLDPAVDAPASSIASSITKSFRSSDLSPEDLYERVAPSVVTIIVKDEDGEAIGSGSGFLIDEGDLPKRIRFFSGTGPVHVITNYHVIRSAFDLEIVFYNGKKNPFPVTIIAEDESSDIALLGVLGISTMQGLQDLGGIALAQRDPRVLTTVYAIGSPKGLSGSASEGKISGIREVSQSERWLQTTAPIDAGSSGGPLLLVDGTLAGVTTAKLLDAQNINFAIPVSSVRSFLSKATRRPRSVQEGASIFWQEEIAFNRMQMEVEGTGARFYFKRGDHFEESPMHPRRAIYSRDQQEAVARLKLAREAMREATLTKGGIDESDLHYRKATVLAQLASDSLPREFKYLFHYVVGNASFSMGMTAATRNWDLTTDFEPRYTRTAHANAAASHLAEGIRLKPDFAPTYSVLASHLTMSGNWTDALLVSDRLVGLMPRCADAYLKRAQCYKELGQPLAAKDDLETAVDLSPKNGTLCYQLAEILAELGESARAIALTERAIELHTTLSVAPAFVHYDMGFAFKKGGNFALAISQFTKAKAAGIPCDDEIAKCLRGLR